VLDRPLARLLLRLAELVDLEVGRVLGAVVVAGPAHELGQRREVAVAGVDAGRLGADLPRVAVLVGQHLAVPIARQDEPPRDLALLEVGQEGLDVALAEAVEGVGRLALAPSLQVLGLLLDALRRAPLGEPLVLQELDDGGRPGVAGLRAGDVVERARSNFWYSSKAAPAVRQPVGRRRGPWMVRSM